MTTGVAAARTAPHRSIEAACLGAVELLLRPERFLRVLLRFRAGSMPLLLIWIAGIARIADVLESQGIRRALHDGGVGTPDLARLEWIRFWPGLLVAGALTGALQWLVAGWWYRVRLRFCGARDVSKRSARLVWLYARSVSSVPSVIWLVVVTPLYDNFYAASSAAPLAVTLLALILWSIFVGYRGALSCFPVRRVPALWWFLILPIGLNVIVILVVIGLVLVASFL